MEFTNPLPFRHQRELLFPKPLDIPQSVQNSDPGDVDSSMEQLRSNSLPTPPAPRPRSPLPPHKLAKLANALGVSTPMPAFYRSPSPSGSSSFRSPSRFLLHIVPPAYLPLDDDDDGSDPDGASAVSASSYRSQFRRGTLIPLYPTLQSQLGAIAREYNLPSTGGLVLYLVLSSHGGTLDGPRISDDVWKLLWHKALQAERQDIQPRTASQLGFRSGRSTPSSPFNRDLSQSLPGTSRAPPSPFPYPSPSTSSTPSSEAHLPFSGQQQTSTPDLRTLAAADLAPTPFLPILAKVEFDIDRRKANWYDAWAHGKQERSRWRNGVEGGRIQLELPQRAESRGRFHHDVSLSSEDSSEYAMLDDVEGENTAVDEDEHDQATVVVHHADPLADVFGNDATTWTEMQADRQAKPLDGLGITVAHPDHIIPPGDDELDGKGSDGEEIVKIWNQNHRPQLTVDPPDPHAAPRKVAPPPLNLTRNVPGAETSSPALPTGNSYLPYLNSAGSHEYESASSGSERFEGKRNRRRTGMVFPDVEVKVVAEPEEMSAAEMAAHRSSQVVMKHKLDQLEKQLAELSPRNLDIPPSTNIHGKLVFESEDDRPLRSAPPGGTFNLSPPRHIKGSPSMGSPRRRTSASNPVTPVVHPTGDLMTQFPPRKDSLSASPWLPQQNRSRSASSPPKREKPTTESAWSPAPFNKPLPSSPPPSQANHRQERSPPQLTIKRASDARKAPGEVSEETQARTAEVGEAQDVLLPAAPVDSDLPIIPLSPDPFGKRPVEDLRQSRHSKESSVSESIIISNGSRPPSRLQGTQLPASVPEDAELDAQSSRFSADSEQGIEHLAKQRRSRTNSIMSVRSLRNLWRKSNASGKGIPPPPVPAEMSPALPPSRPPSQHSRGESSASQRSVRPPTERPRRPSVAPRPDSGSDPFQFDNANIYKSPSSSSLASATATPTTPSVPNFASATGSIGQSKGILKGWTGNANPTDAEARRMRRPSLANLRRSLSTTSTSQSESGDAASSSPPASHARTSTPSSLPDPNRTATRHRQTPSGHTVDHGSISHSLPTPSVLGGLSRYPEAARSSPSPSSGMSFEDGSTPRLSQFEIVSPPIHPTGLIPSASYNGEVS